MDKAKILQEAKIERMRRASDGRIPFPAV